MDQLILLQDLFREQIKFQKRVENLSFEHKLPIDNPVKFQYHMSGMTEELGEVLKADKRWKTHRNSSYIPEEKMDELADVFIEWMNLCIWSGFTCEQMIETINNKIVENNERKDRE